MEMQPWQRAFDIEIRNKTSLPDVSMLADLLGDLLARVDELEAKVETLEQTVHFLERG